MKFCMIAASLAAVAFFAQTAPVTVGARGAPNWAARGVPMNWGARGVPMNWGGRGYFPQYVENIIEVPREVPAPAVTSAAKTLAAADMFLTMSMLGGNTPSVESNSAASYVVNNGQMVRRTSGSHLMNLMMLSQGLGGTGNNQLAMYNLLNRNNDRRFFKVDDQTVTVGTDTFTGYAEVDRNRINEDLMAMTWGGLGGQGLTAGQMFPIILFGSGGPLPGQPVPGQSSGSTNSLDSVQLMNIGASVSGAW
jgi:hypothetical protein